MTFTSSHVELDTLDRWLAPGFGSHVGYGQLVDLYLCVEENLQHAVAAEFQDFDDSRDEIGIEDAFFDGRVRTSETTILAGKLVLLHSVMTHYSGQELIDG